MEQFPDALSGVLKTNSHKFLLDGGLEAELQKFCLNALFFTI
jgi:hypothetical protein